MANSHFHRLKQSCGSILVWVLFLQDKKSLSEESYSLNNLPIPRLSTHSIRTKYMGLPQMVACHPMENSTWRSDLLFDLLNRKRLLLFQDICLSTIHTPLLKQRVNPNVPHTKHISILIPSFNSDCTRENTDVVQKSLKTWPSGKQNLWWFHYLAAWLPSCLEWDTDIWQLIGGEDMQ